MVKRRKRVNAALLLEIALAARLEQSVAHGLAASPPLGAVFDDPVGQSPFKANIMAGLFGLDPFVPENLIAFRLEFTIKRRILYPIVTVRYVLSVARHNPMNF